MLAVHMEAGSHLKRAWEDDNHYHNPEARYGGPPMSELEQHRQHSLSRQQPPPNHILPPIITSETSRLAIERFPSSGTPSSLHDLHGSARESPSKRPRLYHSASFQTESTHSPSPAPGGILTHGPGPYEMRDASPWQKRGSYESISSSREGCHACGGSKEVIDKVVSGLERLEAELRQLLASSPQRLKEVSWSSFVLEC